MADKLIKQLTKLHEDISWEDDNDDTFEQVKTVSNKYGLIEGVDDGYTFICSGTITELLTYIVKYAVTDYQSKKAFEIRSEWPNIKVIFHCNFANLNDWWFSTNFLNHLNETFGKWFSIEMTSMGNCGRKLTLRRALENFMLYSPIDKEGLIVIEEDSGLVIMEISKDKNTIHFDSGFNM